MRSMVDKVINFYFLDADIRKLKANNYKLGSRELEFELLNFHFYLCDLVANALKNEMIKKNDFSKLEYCGHKTLGFTEQEKLEITEHYLHYHFEYFIDLRTEQEFLTSLAKKIAMNNYSYFVIISDESRIYLSEKLERELSNKNRITERRFKI